MELAVFVALLLAFLGAIGFAYARSRSPGHQAPDMAAGSNKPDDQNAFGPAGGQSALPPEERRAQR
jgi:hypothetical protein